MKISIARAGSYSPLAVAALALCGGVGCDQGSRHLPAAPSAVAGPSVVASPAAPAPPTGPPVAVLRFVTLTTHPSAAAGWYDLKVVIAETGGRSGANFWTPVVHWPGNTDYGCAMNARIPAGETWDMDSMGYCAPGPVLTATPTVTVAFTDDEGRAGTLVGTASLASTASQP